MSFPQGFLLAIYIPVFLVMAACSSNFTPETSAPSIEESEPEPTEEETDISALVSTVRKLIRENEVTALEPPRSIRRELVDLGQALLFDKELSGNRDISCMTCHHPTLSTGDARSLSIGQGASGLGLDRVHPDNVFIPRNAPPLFNLHVMDKLFWDGRVEVKRSRNRHGREEMEVITPAGSQITREMIDTFEFGAISVIGMFPVTSREEMRAEVGDNELANIADDDFQGIWQALMERLSNIEDYVEMFETAYPRTNFRDMTFAHASNAMGAFIVSELTFTNTPWDQFLRGNDRALSRQELRGAENFLNLPCVTCHGGSSLSDQDFHNVVLAQFGPGQGNGPSGRDDFGRFNVTDDPANLYQFRSSPLRNVELTAPYGHAGQFMELSDFIDHYSENALKIQNYDESQIEELLRDTILDNTNDIIANRDPLIEQAEFDENTVTELTAFMEALTDDDTRNLNRLIPDSVPSGLPLD